MLRKNLFDIEVYSPNVFPLPEKAEHPINSITIYDSYTDRHYSIIIDPSRAGQKTTIGNWDIYYVKDERNLIILSVKLIRFFQPDVMAGWYSDSFDVPYFFNRCHNLEMGNILNSISPLNYVNIRGKSISGMHLIDMIILDKKIKKRTSYTLANVAIEENLGVEKLEKHEDIMEIYRTDKDRFVKYNKGDVEILEKLEKKNRIIDFFENTRTFAGLNDIGEALKNSIIVDTIALRKAHREGIILPSKPTREESEESEDEDRSGGFVKFPTPGIHRMVAVLDMAKFYPKILDLLNLSTETVIAFDLRRDQIDLSTGDYYVEYDETFIFGCEPKDSNKLTDFLQKNYNIDWTCSPKISNIKVGNFNIKIVEGKLNLYQGKYVRINSKVKGFMPSLYQEFLSERLAVEAEMKKYEIGSDDYNFLMQKRQVVKDTSNSLPGVNGYGGFRLSNNVIANAITFTGQKMIHVATDKLAELKVKDIYGDSVVGNTKILINGKTIEIQKLFEKYNNLKENINGKDIINSNNLNINTLAVDEKGNIISNSVSKIIRHKTNKKLYKITTKSGKSIIVTEDEGLLIYDENNNIKKITPKECINKKLFLPILPDKVECQICKKEFKSIINNTHLQQHRIIPEEYKKLYIGFPTISMSYKEFKGNQIVWNRGIPWKENIIQKLIDSHIGQKVWNKGLHKDTDERVFKHVTNIKRREKISIASKKLWQNPKYANLIMLAHDIKPNKLEQIYIDEFNFLEYVGDGKLIIMGRCPDFKVYGKQKLIEIFGDYWHKGEDPNILIEHYRKYGYECIVIWETETHKNFKDVKERVINFASN